MSSPNESKEYGDYSYPSSGQPWSHTGRAQSPFPLPPMPPSQRSQAADRDHQSNGQSTATMVQTSQPSVSNEQIYPGDFRYPHLEKERMYRPHVSGTLPPPREPHSFQHPTEVHRPYFDNHRFRTPHHFQGRGPRPVPGPRPPSRIDMPRPPFMQQGPGRHRFPHEGQVHGFFNEGPRPRLFGQHRPPIPIDNQRPPFPVDGPRPPFQYNHGTSDNRPVRPPQNTTVCVNMGESEPFVGLRDSPAGDWKHHDNVPSFDGMPGTKKTGSHRPSVDRMDTDSQETHSALHISGGQKSKEEPANLRHVPTNQKDLDCNWVESFIKSRQKQTSDTSERKSISISEVQNLLKEAIVLKKELKNLMNMVQSNPESLREIHAIFEQIRNRLHEIEGVLTDESNSKLLHRKLARIKKKRGRIYRHREYVKQEQEQAESRRNEISARIDQSQASAVQKLVEAKKTNELKKAADSILGEVRRKQTDAKRSLDLLKALAKLRDIRKEKASQKGMYITPQADENFNERSNEMKAMWEKQLNTYQEEQRVLEVMMEVEHEENREKEQEKDRQKEERILRVFSRNLRHSLFGPKVVQDAADPMYPYRQYYDSSNQSLDNLVQIRREWDMFLVSEQDRAGSSLPQGWVGPPAPSGPVWASALKAKPS